MRISHVAMDSRQHEPKLLGIHSQSSTLSVCFPSNTIDNLTSKQNRLPELVDLSLILTDELQPSPIDSIGRDILTPQIVASKIEIIENF